jgi:hypothetical protein
MGGGISMLGLGGRGDEGSSIGSVGTTGSSDPSGTAGVASGDEEGVGTASAGRAQAAVAEAATSIATRPRRVTEKRFITATRRIEARRCSGGPRPIASSWPRPEDAAGVLTD